MSAASSQTGYLGYDPSLLDQLRAAMTAAVGELDSLRCSDHEAAPAMASVARARSVLRDTWLPFVVGLLGCRAMDGYHPAVISSDDLTSSWLAAMAAAHGWATVTDPLTSTAPPGADELTVEWVRVLGASLSGDGGREPMTAAEIVWLDEVLARIATRPELVAAFLPAFTTVGWSNVCEQLAATRRRLVSEATLYDGEVSAVEAGGWSSIDGVFAGLGAILDRDHDVHPDSKPSLLLDMMTPYAAALLVRDLGLDADALASIARDIVEREMAALDQPGQTWAGPQAGDLLFATMLVVDGAPTAYVVSTVDDPALVFAATADPAVAHQLVHVGTSPASMSAADAAEVVPAMVRWILGASSQHASVVHDPQLMVGLADLIAPYLTSVLGAATAWPLSTREQRAVGRMLRDDETAMRRLLEWRTGVVLGAAAGLSAGSDARTGSAVDLTEIGRTIAIIDTLVRLGAIRDAEAALANWDMTWTLVGYTVDAIPVPEPWSKAVDKALDGARWAIEAAGWGPQSVDEAAAHALTDYDTSTTVVAAVLVCAAFDQMVAAGRIPAGTPIPPMPDPRNAHVGAAYARAFQDWLEDCDLDDDVEDELDLVKQTLASDHEAEANAAAGLYD